MALSHSPGVLTNGISVSTLGSGTRLCISRPRVRAKVSSTFGNGPSVCIFTRAQVKVSSTSQEADGWAESNGTSFLQMWERAKQRRADDSEREESSVGSSTKESGPEDWARRDRAFKDMLQVPPEERDKIQRRQIIDRAAAALAAANAFLAQYPVPYPEKSAPSGKAQTSSKPQSASKVVPVSVREVRPQLLEVPKGRTENGASAPVKSSTRGTPGPDFWSWVPDPLDDAKSEPPLQSGSRSSGLAPQKAAKQENGPGTLPWDEYDGTGEEVLPLMFQSRAAPSLPPFQSLLEIEKEELQGTEQESLGGPLTDLRMPEPDTETASAVNSKQRFCETSSTKGLNEDESVWWKETGVEYRDNGVVCNWTVIRGVSADRGTEWEEKFWEASDAYDYKELGAEKSGRDAAGRVWHEFWKEAMWQDSVTGLQHIEKTADKWAQDGKGGQWHEKWYEHYDASGRADKWADKWSEIDPSTQLEPGHAHSWHERWGETYDGHGGTVKYTDKWAERQDEYGGWTKWGDKWDEHFDQYGEGVKQGETWWQGTNGERWNRTWGERHNRTGWVHKYGKSSSGEHWDTHQQEESWYQGKPHFGFRECFEHSVVLRRVGERKRSQL
ncbi:hypothetical protein R1sor_004794 [Riccia sorocarpa]|uniref:Uncharacterized protein n=1 Tax=Riccia sorocarpa TaxID=122646 RepID=A0ABD3HHN8_9MARC